MHSVADLALVGSLALLWLAAGWLADTLPDMSTARALHRRSRALSWLVGVGVVVLVAIPVLASGLGGTSSAPSAALLPAVPVAVVVTVTVRRLAWLRRGAAAFSTAPLAPAPPALRAAAAHPLLVTPLQVTGLATIVSLPIAGGLISVPGAAVAGVAITVVGVVVTALGVRHALRHSRLAESGMPALAPLGRRTGTYR